MDIFPGGENVKFAATFVLNSANGIPIENAEINVSSYSIYTDEAGCAVQYLEDGTYDYTANYDNLVANGSFTIEGESVYVETQLITSINENRIDFNFYPNPGNGVFKLQGLSNSLIEVRDINGRQIRNQQLFENNSSIDLSELKPGIYFLKVITIDGFVTIKKIILN